MPGNTQFQVMETTECTKGTNRHTRESGLNTRLQKRITHPAVVVPGCRVASLAQPGATIYSSLQDVISLIKILTLKISSDPFNPLHPRKSSAQQPHHFRRHRFRFHHALHVAAFEPAKLGHQTLGHGRVHRSGLNAPDPHPAALP
jgi:hypothetical protein